MSTDTPATYHCDDRMPQELIDDWAQYHDDIPPKTAWEITKSFGGTDNLDYYQGMLTAAAKALQIFRSGIASAADPIGESTLQCFIVFLANEVKKRMEEEETC